MSAAFCASLEKSIKINHYYDCMVGMAAKSASAVITE